RRTLGTNAASTERSRTVRRIHQRRVRKLEQFLMQAVIEQAGELLRSVSGRQIRPPDVTDEQRVTGQNSPRRGRTRFIGDDQAHAFGSVAGSFESLDSKRPYFDAGAIPKRGVFKGGMSLPSDVDRRS